MPYIFNEIMGKDRKRESKEVPEKDKCHYQISISIRVNIHKALRKLKIFSSISDKAELAKFMQTSPNNQCSLMIVRLQTAIPHVFR